MLNRQKTLLALLKQASRPVKRTELTKWAFLLRQESASGGGSAFYDFVPYHYGPFSFSLYQEAGKLENQGYLAAVGDNAWTLGSVESPAPDDAKVAVDIRSIIQRFGRSNIETLLDYVYERYPAYTVHSKRKRLAEKPLAPLGVYTAGYEGRSVDAFLNRLVEVGIRHLIDVRMNPIARRYGFHRSTLNRLCEGLGIRYSHVPALGIHSAKRKSLETKDDYEALFGDYRATTLREETTAIDQVASWVRESPSVLVCMEAEPCSCHRSHLAAVVSTQCKLPIHHIV